MKRGIGLLCILLTLLSGCNSAVETAPKASPQVTAAVSKPQPPPEKQTGIIPAMIEIPAIGVKADIEKVGLLPDGSMGAPKGSKAVAWYEQGTKPGERGNAVMAGHVDDTVNPAVFFDLNKLKKDDTIYVTDQNGRRLTFVVRDIQVYPRQDAPLDQIFGYTYQNMLNLITCEGKYDPKTTERAERLVVFSELVQ
ncbi:class F sortase [Ectobacillus ponti]|uniref:Class F sortase n=1 Tax=Ectobacillus ponti TaxID=2961894 RepID=A0AA42BS48_9BACI|nr:class F sortase [Ectobacillus ponti]MCP8968068.1 class F sortase [Ectobacillus ponti]